MRDLRGEAERLAGRPYRVVVFLDETTDGEPGYVALNPELEGCVSQGVTPDEAVHNLAEARVDYIYFLLEDGLDVPAPQLLSSHTTIFVSEYMQDYAGADGESAIYDNKPDHLWPQTA